LVPETSPGSRKLSDDIPRYISPVYIRTFLTKTDADSASTGLCQHFRVFWDDAATGPGRLKIYDSIQPEGDDEARGIVLGGIIPDGIPPAIPDNWRANTVMTFLERVPPAT